LGDDAVEGVVGDAGEIGFGFEDGGVGEIAGEAEDLDVAVLADDDGEAAFFFDEAAEVGVGEVDEGAGGILDDVAGLAPAGAGDVGRAVGCDHDAMGYGASGVRVIIESGLVYAEGLEALAGDGVVDELAEDGEGFAFGETLGEGEGVADAEADAVMFSEVDGHGDIRERALWDKVFGQIFLAAAGFYDFFEDAEIILKGRAAFGCK
jgi:hypothetical protein